MPVNDGQSGWRPVTRIKSGAIDAADPIHWIGSEASSQVMSSESIPRRGTRSLTGFFHNISFANPLVDVKRTFVQLSGAAMGQKRKRIA